MSPSGTTTTTTTMSSHSPTHAAASSINLNHPQPPSSPLAAVLAALPSTLASLSLHLTAPHYGFSSPPHHLASLAHLQLTNYCGGSTHNAWVLASGLPKLRSLCLAWPVLPAMQQRRLTAAHMALPGRAAQPIVTSAAPSWMSESDVAAFARWRRRYHHASQHSQPLQQGSSSNTSATLGDGSTGERSGPDRERLDVGAGPQDPDMSLEPLPHMSFWQVLALLPCLSRLELSLDPSSTPLDDLPRHLTQLQVSGCRRLLGGLFRYAYCSVYPHLGSPPAQVGNHWKEAAVLVYGSHSPWLSRPNWLWPWPWP